MPDPQTSFHGADVDRREPEYEPDATVRFPTAGAIDNHTLADAERADMYPKIARSDRQLSKSIFVAQQIVDAITPVCVVRGVPGGQERGGSRKAVSIFNLGSVVLFVAGQEATCNAGLAFPIPAGTGFTWDKEPWGDIWAIAASATCDVRAMVEQGYGGDVWA